MTLLLNLFNMEGIKKKFEDSNVVTRAKIGEKTRMNFNQSIMKHKYAEDQHTLLTAAILIIRNTKLQSTFNYDEKISMLEKTFSDDPELDYDFTVCLKPSRTTSIKARINSIKKYSPKIFFD